MEKSRQHSHFYINEILSKLWLWYSNKDLEKLRWKLSEVYVIQWLSPYDIMSLDLQLIEKNLYDRKHKSFQSYVQSKITDKELYEHFEILFL